MGMATASAGRATRVRRGLRAFRAPLSPTVSRFEGRAGAKTSPRPDNPAPASNLGVDMTRHDPEIEELREKVHCAVVLEQTPPCWRLDRKESTKLSLKYRRGKGET